MLVFEAGKNNLRALSPPITIIHHFFSVVPCRPQSHCLLAFWAVWLPVKDPEDQEAEEARAFGCNVTIRYTRLACPMPHHVSRSNHSLWYCKHLGSLAFASVNSEHVWTLKAPPASSERKVSFSQALRCLSNLFRCHSVWFMSTSDVEADRSVSKAQEAGTDSETARAMRKGEPEKPWEDRA